MNMASNDYEDQEIQYKTEFRYRGDRPAAKQQSSRPTYGRRRGKAPQQHNGMHRRRRRRIMW